MRFRVGAATDVGRMRSLNEDGFLVVDDLIAVADGMGGHRGGEVASELALAAFESAATVRTTDGLAAAVRAANLHVFEASRANPELTGMGTTLCVAAPLDDRHVGVANVGDSRVYLQRSHALVQISEDHSFVESLVRDGRLTRAQADVHPQRNVLTRALGIEPELDVDAWEIAVVDGDRLLLCSDGLFNELPDVEIQRILDDVTDPPGAAAALIDAANAAGGRDNITCVVVAIDEVGTPSDPDLGPTVATPVEATVRRTLPTRDDATALDVSRPTPAAAAPTVSPPPPAAPAAPTAPSPAAATPAAGGSPPAKSPKRFTWRTALFLLALVTVFAVAVAAIDVVYRNQYSVIAEDDEVTILRGPLSPVLWITPTTLAPTGVSVGDLPDEIRRQVEEGRDGFSSEAAARRFVDRFKPTTTTTTTSTTVAPTTTALTTVPETTVAAVPPPATPS